MTAIAITGMHRTGTSMVAKSLRLGGLYLGSDADLVDPAPDNPEGFFEHAGFVRFDDDLLEAVGGAWDHPPSCAPLAADDPRVVELRPAADALVAGLSVEERWGWKDPRTCLTARYWLDVLPELRFVVCVRHPLEVALSIKRRNQVSYAHALALWRDYYDALLDAVPEDRRIVTHYDGAFGDPVAEVERLLTFTGLSADAEVLAREALDRRLRHHHLDVTLEDAGAPASLVALYERLCEEAGVEPVRRVPAARDIRVDRAALDLALAGQHLERRGRQVESLQRERDELLARVAELEAAAGGQLLAGVHARLDAVEDAVHDVRYRSEAADRADAAVVQGCRELVRAHVPRASSVLVVCKGDPALLDLYARPASTFPQDERGRYCGFTFADSIAAIAHLEALRARGAAYLLVPATSSWWLDHFAAFAEHLAARYHVVADEPGVGLLVSLTARPGVSDEWPRGLSHVVERLAAAGGHEPAVLDWTGRGVAAHLPDRNVFVPPEPGEPVLPYLDGTVDVVLVDDPVRHREARRVAVTAVVRVEPGQAAVPVVEGVDLVEGATGTSSEAVLVVVDGPDPDERWLDAVVEAIGDDPSAEVLVGPDAATLAARAAEAGAVVLLERGAVPLPGALRVARTTLESSECIGAVAAKSLRGDGALDAAGAIVFADGSWAGVAAASQDVSAPWHDYVRDTCGGTGLLVLRGSVMEKVASAGHARTPAGLVAWSGRVWDAGFRVVYQPEAAVVQIHGRAGDAGDAGAVAESWAPALGARPDPPAVPDDAAWRSLVASDDPVASWR